MLINIRRALEVIVSIYNVHVIFFIENYTEVFHVVYKGNVPSFQCKISLDRLRQWEQ